MAKRLQLTPEQLTICARDYIVQSETVRGEPRQHWGETRARIGSSSSPTWAGPSRRTRRAAEIDIEYHVAGRDADRPPCFYYGF